MATTMTNISVNHVDYKIPKLSSHISNKLYCQQFQKQYINYIHDQHKIVKHCF